MLRVGLTGGLGSGKSTVAGLLRGLGAYILEADAIARELMQPGEQVYGVCDAIVARFGPGVVLADGQLDRAALARIAFAEGRVEELNAIVHPATIARQAELAEAIAARDPDAVVVVESALILETKYGGAGGWRLRFDKLILVTAPEEMKVARFVARMAAGRMLTKAERAGLEAEAHRRLAQQMPDEQKAELCDYVLVNDGPLKELEWQVEQLWPLLARVALADGHG
ncbi:MAG TPA: dephospho-CoA kinase [Granulicella sp.]|jgi:dephospho-CoA kinase|nr:dephospho-CoA kinase [Granulicella sp.]